MAQNSRFWDGHTTGDSTDAPYSDLDWADTERWKFAQNNTNQGVINGLWNELNVADVPGDNHVDVDSGAALVNGRLYSNEGAFVTIAISGVSTWWIIGLFSDESAHTIRAFGRGGYASEAAALASLVQVVGGDWEIPLATVHTTAGQLVDHTYDQRVYAMRTTFCEFVPAINGSVGGVGIDREYLGVPLPDSALSYAYGNYVVQPNYRGTITIVPVMIPAVNGNLFYLNYAAWHQLGNDMTAYASGSSALGSVLAGLQASHVEVGASPTTVTGFKEGGNDFIQLILMRDSTDPSDTISGIVYVCGWQIIYDVLY